MADRFDLDAIEADDALLDLLAAGGESARAAGEHDPAVALLAELRLAVEVEDELPVETIDDPESFLARCAALNPITDPFARKVATRGLAFGVAAVAALSVSGVAAAVTGDPLSPYEKVIEKMVDAVRPQTSFPTEDLNGLPVVDRSTIVKVGKDFKAKAKAEQARAGDPSGDAGDDVPQTTTTRDEPGELLPEGKPLAVKDPLGLPIEKPKAQDPGAGDGDTKTTVEPTETKPTAPPETTDDSGDKPTDTPTDTPTDAPTDTPTDTPTDPPTTPTDQPTDTGTPTPTPTDPTTTTPPNGDAGTDGGTTDGGTTDGGTSGGTENNTTTDPGTGNPTGTPSAGGGDTAVPSDDTTPTPGGSSDDADPAGTTTPGDGEKPGSEVTQVPQAVQDALTFVVDTAVAPVVLPTPTGEPTTLESAERFFGRSEAAAKPAAKAKPAKTTKATKATKAKADGKQSTAKKAAKKAAKHSNGQVSVGSVRKTYAKGKHSSGQYPEGKHAAIARTHGSTADGAVLQILGVVNQPTTQR
ncbi:hypothetical protein [Kribbella sp. HUAS MG21]|uniref:Uncharacterized protein n=1 Tax=Kribbella sp. HUAS MG21 TaxID=3160966 RepID=A0AAU7TMR6_9ACTN